MGGQSSSSSSVHIAREGSDSIFMPILGGVEDSRTSFAIVDSRMDKSLERSVEMESSSVWEVQWARR